ANHSLASGSRDQLAVEQSGDDAAGIHAADLADLRNCDGLLVSDDSKGFERRQREPYRRLETFGESANDVMLVRLGGHAVTAGDLAHFDPVIGRGVSGTEFLESGPDLRAQ